jgi:hypothetical protein
VLVGRGGGGIEGKGGRVGGSHARNSFTSRAGTTTTTVLPRSDNSRKKKKKDLIEMIEVWSFKKKR